MAIAGMEASILQRVRVSEWRRGRKRSAKGCGGMKTTLWQWMMLVVQALLLATPGLADQRVALVIGNGD